MASKDFKEWFVRVEDGKVGVWVWDAILDAVRAHEGKNFTITLREQKRKRSVNLNAFYWGFIVTPVMEALRELGNYVDVEETHEFLKQHVGKLKQVIVTAGGEVHFAPGSTKKMSGSEMVKYIEMIRAWAAEVLNIALPFPNEHPDSTPQPKKDK
jgi:hypothetical protein